MAGNEAFGRALLDVAKRITDKFTESDWRELGVWIDEYETITGHSRLLRSLVFNDADYGGNVISVIRSISQGDPNRLATIASFVEEKYPVGELVSTGKAEGRRIAFIPKVFRVPEEPVDDRLVSVMMPFAGNFTPVYDAIKKAAGYIGMECLRVDDIWDDTTVIQDVFSLIYRARIVVCDFSTKNPNVFYEAGIAHTLGKDVVPITQHKDDIPFDLQHHRYLPYLNNAEGLEGLCDGLVKRFAKILE